ncbi:MAG: anaerobic sulfatase maturase [Actinomycetaceae bacterium]|nr:anaerobic sulfatase maturase [Actinomycetaceae bacterium]
MTDLKKPLERKRLPLSVVTKPTGAACNLDCDYCFFLSKELLYDDRRQQMSLDSLETYIAEYLAASSDGEVTMLWQGGEPTMRGIDFFSTAFELAEAYKRPSQRVNHALQTNATLINEDWARLFKQYDVLVGVSIDGPEDIHDAYRHNRAGRGSYADVVRGWKILQNEGVRANILCTVHAQNQDHPLRVYRHFRDDLGAQFMQFIPIVERVEQADLARAESGWRPTPQQREAGLTGLLYQQKGDAITSRSVDPKKYGQFLTAIFDEWIKTDVGSVYVQDFDGALASIFGQPTVCHHAPECGNNLAMEFNGDVYACDHWVEPDWKLGNVHDASFADLVETDVMHEFSKKKNDQLTSQCRDCRFLRFCWGGCPKDRFVTSVDGEEGHNYLCPGYTELYGHIRPDIVGMARLLRAGRAPAEIMNPAVRARVRPA